MKNFIRIGRWQSQHAPTEDPSDQGKDHQAHARYPSLRVIKFIRQNSGSDTAGDDGHERSETEDAITP